MSSFTEYHKKWKEENGRGEDSPYKQRSISEIEKSADEYVNSIFEKEGKIWDKIKSKANNNLSYSNNMQNFIDRNTRNQMAKPMEDYMNTKKIAMQNVSNYVQQNAKQQTVTKEKSTWDKIKEKLQFGTDTNRVPIYMDNSGKVDKNKTTLAIAQQNFESDKQKLRMMESKKAYDKKMELYEKAMDEQLKNTLNYKEVQRQNPNATEEELLKITKKKNEEFSRNFVEWLADMEPAGRNAKIEGFTKDVIGLDKKIISNKNEKYDIKAKVQAIETQKEADKINQDMQNGNYLSSALHVARGLPVGAMNAVIKTTTALENLSGYKHPSSAGYNTDPVKEAELQTRKYQETTSKINNGIVQTGSTVTNTIGEMVPAMVANVAVPGSGAVVNAVNVGSSGYLDALNEDGTNKAQAGLTGTLKGLASFTIEKITGGNILSEGSLDDWAAKTIANKTAGITNKTANKVAQKIASKIYEVGGEVLEEELENQVDYLIDATINDKGITLKEWLNEQGETVKNTALTQLTLSLFGLGGDTYNKVNEYLLDSDAKKWVNEAQKIIDKENLEINTDKIKERELRNVLNQVNIKEDNQASNNTTNLQQNLINNQINPLEQQINQAENKMSQNGNMEQIEDSNKNIAYNNSNYYQTANKYKLDTNNKTIKGIYEVASKRGVSVIWDDTAFTNSSQNAKWTVDNEGNRSVVLNPKANTDTALQSVMIHELTHDFEGTKEYNKISSMVLERLKSSNDYDNIMSDIANAYQKEYKNMSKEQFSSMIEQEAIADYLGENLGNQEFVNDLVRSTDRTQIQKIIDWVKNKITSLKNTLTGNKELNYWNKIKDNFERAYNQEYQGNNNDNRLSIAGKEGMNNAIKQDTRYIQLERSYNKAQQMQKIGIDNEKIRQSTNWFQDRNGDWKFEFSDKDMKLKSNVNLKENTTYKLGDILEHDTLFTVYPELIEHKITFKNLNDVNGLYDRKTGEININNKLILSNSAKTIEGTLIHEIQHIIQNLEEFEGGRSQRTSKLAYYNSLGEIEASNTKTRFLEEKYNGKELSNIPPESSKANPKHQRLDNYLENRNLFDKAKDSIYNYIKGKVGDNYEISKEVNEKNKDQHSNLVVGRKGRRYVESENNSGSLKLPISDKLSKQSNGTWQQYLKDTSVNTGTRETLKDIRRVPISEENLQRSKKAEKESKAVIPLIESQQANVTPLRTIEEVANDSNITDLQAFQEATEQLDTPSDRILQQRENDLNSKGIEKSPTIDYIKQKRSKEKASLTEIKDVLAQKFVNKGHYIDKLAKQIGNDNLTYLYDRTLNTFNEAQISIGDYQINSKGEKVGKSIIDIFEPSKKANLSLEFDDYLLNKHNVSRYAHEKGIFGDEISAVDSKKIVEHYENKYPDFKEWASEVSKYNDNNLRDLVDNGMISENTYKKLKEMYGDYVPTYRDITDNISQYIDDSVGGNTLGKATQSDRDILSISESMAEQTLMIKKAIRMNNLGIELYNAIGKKGAETLKGVEFSDIAIQTLGGDVIEKATDGSNKFIIFQDGEMTKFKISDELYTAFSKDTLQNKINNSKVAKAMLTPIEKMSKAQRELLTTYSIGFAIRNPFVDFQEGLFNSKYGGATFVKNWAKALYNIGIKGSWYESYKNNGGTANTYFDYSKGIVPIKTKNPIKMFGDAIKKVNEVIEQAPRLAEYISTIEHGGSIDQALYNSAEVTTNFKRGGDVTKAVNKYGANFLNASVQGLDKLYRNLSGQRGWKGYANILTKATVYMIAPAIINSLLLGDDKDYEDLPEYIKDEYFLFKTGEGRFFRIPKGRTSSVIGGLARRCLEAGQDKDVDWKSLVDTTINQLAPNNPFKDNIIAPIVQAVKNEAWYGGEIVSNRLKGLPVAEQYDESTDELSKFIGEKLNISPKKINYVLDQYSGGIGDVVLPIITPQAENNILEDKFTTDSVMKNKHISEYYSKLEELEKNKNSQNASDEDKLKYKYMTEVSEDLSDLYNTKKTIQNSNKSDEIKRKEVREVQRKINNVIEKRLEKYEKIKVTSLTAKVGDSEYYKYNNEWTKLSDKEKEKNKEISLNSYADYKNKIYNLTEKKTDSGELKENQQLKDKDKIDVLLDSNYSNKEKASIYENYIKSKSKEDEMDLYDIMKLTGININQYLRYEQQEFKSDKEADGTKNGKTIKGSKPKKVYDYVNNMNITREQRLAILGSQYKLNRVEQKELYSYLYNLPIETEEERMKMFSKYSKNFIIYNDDTMDYK